MTVALRIALLGALALPATAIAKTPAQEAKALVASAMKAHEAGNFAKALADLQAAYDKDPQPELLYAIAQVEVKLDDCTAAIAHYEQFLATSPSEQAATDTREAIDACKAKLPPPPPPVVVAPPPPPPPPTITPIYRDMLGLTLVSAGAVAGLFGGILYASARGELDDAETAGSVAQYDKLVDSAHTKRTISVVLVGGGIALIAGGVARMVLRDRTEHPQLAVVPTPQGALVTLGGAW